MYIARNITPPNVLAFDASERNILWCELICEKYCCLSSYTKPKGQLPDYEAPVVLKLDHCTVEDFCNKLHRSIIKEFK